MSLNFTLLYLQSVTNLSPLKKLENIRQSSLALNDGKGTALHWFTTKDSYADPQRFFEPIWKTGRTGDEVLHSLLESRRDRGEE